MTIRVATSCSDFHDVVCKGKRQVFVDAIILCTAFSSQGQMVDVEIEILQTRGVAKTLAVIHGSSGVEMQTVFDDGCIEHETSAEVERIFQGVHRLVIFFAGSIVNTVGNQCVLCQGAIDGGIP